LVEYQANRFTKQSYCLDRSSTTVVYGPNGSGKSIYLKSLANIVYLAQIGCFVPCESAQLPVFDKILTQFTSFEDSMLQKSHFYQEAAEIKSILESCDRGTLVLIDEYARATSHMNGLALFMTLVECLTQPSLIKDIQGSSKASLPTTLISTNL
jgi:DNA mismatch repair ATPase MutS